MYIHCHRTITGQLFVTAVHIGMPVMDTTLVELQKERRVLTCKLRAVNKKIDNKYTELRKAYEQQQSEMKNTLKSVKSTLGRSMKIVKMSISTSTARIQLAEAIRKTHKVRRNH